MIPKRYFWDIRSSNRKFHILTPWFMFSVYDRAPCFYYHGWETGMEFGWMPSCQDRGYELDFKWYHRWNYSRVGFYDWITKRA